MYRFIIILLLSICRLSGFAQIKYKSISANEIKANVKDTSLIKKIKVVDNRFDTTGIFTELTGIYPINRLTFIPSTCEFIESYLNNLIGINAKNSDTVVLEISELRIPNRPYINQTGLNKINKINYARGYIFLEASLYKQFRSLQYQKIGLIKKKYRTFGYIEKSLETVFEELLAFVQKGIIAESNNLDKNTGIMIMNDSCKLSIDKIYGNRNHLWADYPINLKYSKENDSTSETDGIYSGFDDFKSNKIQTCKVDLILEREDSLFYLASNNNKTSPYAILKSGTFYINLFENFYLPAQIKDNTFFIYLPSNFLNAYDFLSVLNGFGGDYINSQLDNGNIFKNPARLFSMKKAMQKKAAEQEKEQVYLNNNRFHSFYLDMYNGDFIFEY